MAKNLRKKPLHKRLENEIQTFEASLQEGYITYRKNGTYTVLDLLFIGVVFSLYNDENLDYGRVGNIYMHTNLKVRLRNDIKTRL